MLKRNGIDVGELRLTNYNPGVDLSEQGDIYPSAKRNVIHFHFRTVNAATFYSIEKNDKMVYPMPITMQQGDQIMFIWKAEAVTTFSYDHIKKSEQTVLSYNGQQKKRMSEKKRWFTEKKMLPVVGYATGHFSYMNEEDSANFINDKLEKIYE